MRITKDQISAAVIGAAFVTVVFFAGYAKGEVSFQRSMANDLLTHDNHLMLTSECISIIGKNVRGR